jgi:type I restriction enzyme S subunit
VPLEDDIAPRIEQGWSPECHNIPASDEEWGVLKAGCCNGGVFHQQENKSLPLNLVPPLDLEVKPGDVLMSRASGSTELIGSVALVPEGTRSRLLLSDKTYRIRLDTMRAIQSYFVVVLGSDVGRVQMQEVISGAAGLANNIAQGDIKEFAIPLPPVDEQSAIVAHVAAETAKLDALRTATERTVALLKERRAALIAAAVTGRLDVQGAERHLDVVAD